jgi:WD40 repeat protein
MDAGQLQKCRKQLHEPMPLIGGWFQNQVLKNLATDGSAEAVRLLYEAISDGADKSLKEAAFGALREMAAAGNVPACECVCRLAIRSNYAPARKTALAAGYRPHDENQRALFFFLTGQWKEYEALDVQHRFLRAAYENADPKLRARIAAKARSAGRVELVDVISGGKQARRVGDMTAGEWTAAGALLEQGERWDDLWRLAQEAPPYFAVQLLRRLRRAARITKEPERAGCEQLISLAKELQPLDLEPYFFQHTAIEGHQREVRCLTFDRSGTLLVSGGADGAIVLWNMPSGRKHAVLEGHRNWINYLKMTPDGETLISVARDGRLCLWRLPDGKRLRKVKCHEGAIFGLAISPRGDLLATCGADRLVRVWSLPGTKLLATMKKHRGAVTSLAITPDGNYLASGSADSDVCIWSLPSGKLLKTLTEHRDELHDGILAIACHPDGRMLASSGTDGVIRLWSLPGGRELRKLRIHAGNAGSLAFSPDGTKLISAGGEYSVQIWDIASAAPEKTIEGHVTENCCIAISNRGGFLATSGSSIGDIDHSIRVWSLREGQPISTLLGHERGIGCMALSPDDRLLASGSGDGSIRIWSAQPERLEMLPAGRATLHDLESAERLLALPELPRNVRQHVEFTAALLRWRRRLDIVVGDAAPRVIELGEFDIEIEG